MCWNNQRGAMLITTILVMVVLSILGIVFLQVMTQTGVQTIAHGHQTQAYYYARAGAEAALHWLDLEEFLSPTGYWGEAYLWGNLLEMQEGPHAMDTDADPIFVKISKDPNEDAIHITSRGLAQEHRKTVSLTIPMVPGEEGYRLFEEALFAADEGTADLPAIKLTGDAKVKGTVGTNTKAKHSIVLEGGPGFEAGEVHIGPGEDPL